MSTGRGASMGAAKRRAAAQERTATTVATDYGTVRTAFFALRELSAGQTMGGKALDLTLALPAIFRIKRMVAALRPLVAQSDEVISELHAKAGYNAQTGFGDVADAAEAQTRATALKAELETAMGVAVEVECELLDEQDFAGAGNTTSVLAGVLDALGPFWE